MSEPCDVIRVTLDVQQTRRRSSGNLILAHRLRRWPNIVPVDWVNISHQLSGINPLSPKNDNTRFESLLPANKSLLLGMK